MSAMEYPTLGSPDGYDFHQTKRMHAMAETLNPLLNKKEHAVTIFC